VLRRHDRKRIVDNFFPGGRPLPTTSRRATSSSREGDPWYAFDKDAARAVDEALGAGNRFSTKIYYRTWSGHCPTRTSWSDCRRLQDNLGIAEIVQESGTFSTTSAGLSDGLTCWLGADYPDPTNFRSLQQPR
jgi:hypothetical protein